MFHFKLFLNFLTPFFLLICFFCFFFPLINMIKIEENNLMKYILFDFILLYGYNMALMLWYAIYLIMSCFCFYVVCIIYVPLLHDVLSIFNVYAILWIFFFAGYANSMMSLILFLLCLVSIYFAINLPLPFLAYEAMPLVLEM